MRRIVLIALALVPFICFANDGLFHPQAGSLKPVKETNIEMQKEILYIKKVPDGTQVNVYFEFYNPGEARDEIVGFVTPPYALVMDEEYYQSDEYINRPITEHPRMKGFMVYVNDVLVPYEVTYFERSGFNSDILGANGGDYVYFFKVHFEKGVNVVRHHYEFSCNLSENYFTYRLTTGKMWAKDAIGDFELIIDAPGEVLSIQRSFFNDNSEAPWLFSGIVKSQNSQYSLHKNIYIKNGLVHCKYKDFKPDKDLVFSFIPVDQQVDDVNLEGTGIELRSFNKPFFYHFDVLNFEPLLEFVAEYTTDELQILINFFYAKHGFPFKTPAVIKMFENCVWYIPDPAVNNDNIEFTEYEKFLLAVLKKERARR